MRIFVARELCLFLHVDAKAIPARERAGFVMLAVRRAAPFSDPEVDIVWCGDHAAVWYWSAARILSLTGTLPPRSRFKAEASHRGAVPPEDALELLDLSMSAIANERRASGFEARLWRSGHLLASRWWAELPSLASWQVFLRGAGLQPLLPIPAPERVELREQALGGGTQASALTHQLQAQWPLLATIAGCLVFGLFCMQIAGIGRAYVENSRLEKRTAQLEKHLESVITARNTVDEATGKIDALLALRPAASQTQLMAEIAKITPAGNWSVIQWQQPSPETLEVTLKGSGLDTSAVVSAWEKSPLLQDVTPASSGASDELTIRARLTAQYGKQE